MIFIDYRLILLFAVPVILLALSVWGNAFVGRGKDSLVRSLARIAMIGLGSLSSLALLIIGCETIWTSTTNSNPIFSPDHKSAVRVIVDDAGALGGDTAVDVYTNHGFKNGTILAGDWKIVEAKDIHWLSNTEILIEYDATSGSHQPDCKRFNDIHVICQPLVTLNR